MARNGMFSRRRRSERIDGFGDLSPSDSHDVHVLAVDDSLVDRKVIERLLKITSCKVTAVDSGRRALQFLGLDEEKRSVGIDDLKVDLIITDYCMPGMTGYELLKKIKGSSTFREVPVVIMSSENVLARIDRCLEEGAEDFIVKPVKLSDVKRLKDYMFGDSGINGVEEDEDRVIQNKRKLQDMSDDYASSPTPTPTPTPTPSSSSPSSPQSISSSPSPSRPSSTSTSTSTPTPSPPPPPPPPPPPYLPSLLDSPTRRLKMTNYD